MLNDVKYAALMLQKFSEDTLEPMGPDGRLNVMSAIYREAGLAEDVPVTIPGTSIPNRMAEEYHRMLNVLIGYALADGPTMAKPEVSKEE